CMMVNPYNVENILDHISSCTSKKIILFLKIMVTFCDHLSGTARSILYTQRNLEFYSLSRIPLRCSEVIQSH
ncbi:hypothetical protein ELY20_16455, partial [Legionella qingyii]